MLYTKLILIFLGFLTYQVSSFHEINHDAVDMRLPNAHRVTIGKCPLKPEEVPTNVKDKFDIHKIEGIWKLMYDEKQLNDNYTCMGTKFISHHEHGDHVLEFMQSLGVTTEFRQFIATHDSTAHHEPHEYYTSIGRQMNFRHHSDKTIAYIEPYDIHQDHNKETLKTNKHQYDPSHWETQYLRFAKVLDTDNENFLIMYSCQESAKYFDKEHNMQELSHHDAHQYADISVMEAKEIEDLGDKERTEKEEHDLLIANHHHTYTHVTLKNHIEVRPVHVQDVQILWRAGKATIPKEEQKQMHHDEQSQEWEHVKQPSSKEMEKMIEVIEKLLPKQFSKTHLESKYAWMNQVSNSPIPEMDFNIEHTEDGDTQFTQKLANMNKDHNATHNETETHSQMTNHHAHHENEDLRCNYDPYHMHGYDQGMSHHLEHHDGTEHDPQGHENFSEDMNLIEDHGDFGAESHHEAEDINEEIAHHEHPGVDPNSEMIESDDEHEEIHVNDEHIEHEDDLENADELEHENELENEEEHHHEHDDEHENQEMDELEDQINHEESGNWDLLGGNSEYADGKDEM